MNITDRHLPAEPLVPWSFPFCTDMPYRTMTASQHGTGHFCFLELRSNFHSIFIWHTRLRFQSSQLHWTRTRTRTSYEEYCLLGISKSLNYTLKKNLPIFLPFPLLSDHNCKWLCVDHYGKKYLIDTCWTTGTVRR